MIELRLPLPPSVNHMYFSGAKRGVRALTSKARHYKQLATFKAATQIRGRTLDASALLHVERTYYFPETKVWSKKGTLKNLDVDNYVKAVDDVILPLLGVDDRQIFKSENLKKSVKDSEGFMVYRVSVI